MGRQLSSNENVRDEEIPTMKTASQRRLVLSLIVLGALSLTALARAEVKLASPFSSHMVLQREIKVPVWGTADAGETVTVEFAGQKKSATAGADGKWRLTLDPLEASAEPRDFAVSSVNRESKIQNLKLTDVLVGEVWLASGQSNMVFPVSKAHAPYAGLINEAEEIAAANYPLIRMFTVRDTKSYEPKSSATGTWTICSPATVPDFSAIGYLFARDVQKEIGMKEGFDVGLEVSGRASALGSAPAQSRLVFRHEGDAYSLADIWWAGYTSGVQLAPPKESPAMASLHPPEVMVVLYR